VKKKGLASTVAPHASSDSTKSHLSSSLICGMCTMIVVCCRCSGPAIATPPPPNERCGGCVGREKQY